MAFFKQFPVKVKSFFAVLAKPFTRIPRWIRWTIVVVLAVAIVVGGFSIYRSAKQASQATATQSAAMQTSTATIGDLIIYADGTGTLIPKAEMSFGFGASGPVTAVNVKVGDSVTAGQVLATLDDSDAQAAYTDAQRALRELTSAAAVATAEQAVATDKQTLLDAKYALAYVESPTVLEWQDKLTDAQAALAAATVAAATDTSDAAQQAVTTAQKSVDYAQASLAYAWKVYTNEYVPDNFTETTTNPRTGEEEVIWYTDADTGEKYTKVDAPSQATIDADKAAYNLAKATLVEDQNYLAALNGETIPADATGSKLMALYAAQSTLTDAQTVLQGTQLTAPISGVVTSLNLQVGDQAAANNAVITIDDLSQPYQLTVYLDESDWQNVAVGNEAQVTFDLLPDDTLAGTVIEKSPALVSTGGTGVISCKVQLTDNTSMDLPSGAGAAVEVIGGKALNAVLVPVEALHQISADQYAVFVLVNGELETRLVTVGIQDLVHAQIISGLSAGEVVSTGIVETK
jgi:RND family efflux transporter MFP subunit